jgi:hypothetical protein
VVGPTSTLLKKIQKMSSSPTPSFKFLWFDFNGYGQPLSPRYENQFNGDSVGGCCGSAYYDKNCAPKIHKGIVVYPENVEVIYNLKPEKYITEQVVTKNGTFNVSLRIAK